jgi:hypothetical protein
VIRDLVEPARQPRVFFFFGWVGVCLAPCLPRPPCFLSLRRSGIDVGRFSGRRKSDRTTENRWRARHGWASLAATPAVRGPGPVCTGGAISNDEQRLWVALPALASDDDDSML